MDDAEAAETDQRRVEQGVVPDQPRAQLVDEALGDHRVGLAFEPDVIIGPDDHVQSDDEVLDRAGVDAGAVGSGRHRPDDRLSVARPRCLERELFVGEGAVQPGDRIPALDEAQRLAVAGVVGGDAWTGHCAANAQRFGVDQIAVGHRGAAQRPPAAEGAQAGAIVDGVADEVPQCHGGGVVVGDLVVGVGVPDIIDPGDALGDAFVPVGPFIATVENDLGAW